MVDGCGSEARKVFTTYRTHQLPYSRLRTDTLAEGAGMGGMINDKEMYDGHHRRLALEAHWRHIEVAENKSHGKRRRELRMERGFGGEHQNCQCFPQKSATGSRWGVDGEWRNCVRLGAAKGIENGGELAHSRGKKG